MKNNEAYDCEGIVNCSNIFTDRCNECNKTYCEECMYSFKPHRRCLRCMDLFCKIYQIDENYLCRKCMDKEEQIQKESKQNNYHYITPLVAIGNRNTPYDEFDIIINLNYPHNQSEHHAIDIKLYCEQEEEAEMREMLEDISKDEENEKKYKKFYKSIYNIGLNDHSSEASFMKEDFIPYLLEELSKEKNRNRKILFHCYAGVSRSATMAMIYLKHTSHHQYSLLDLFNMVREKREVVCPNYTFIQVMSSYFKDTSILEHSFDIETLLKMRNEEVTLHFLKYNQVENLNTKTKYFGTILELACQLDSSYEIISLLLKKGANPKIGIPLHLYLLNAVSPSIHIIQLLVDHGCDINKRDSSKFTPLFHAKQRELDHSIIFTMMNRGAYLYNP